MADDPLEKEAVERLKLARAQKAQARKDLEEAYFFAAPYRDRSVSSEQAPRRRPEQDPDTPATAVAIEAAGDHVAHILDTFMPPYVDWARRGPGMVTRQDDWVTVQKRVSEADRQIMQAIRASGFYAAAYQAFNPDLYVGTAAMWIDPAQISFHLPPCWGVPIRELEVNVGPLGDIDDRFVVKNLPYAKARLLLGPGAVLPADAKKKQDNETCRVEHGFWRIYDQSGEVRWQHVVLFDGKKANEHLLTGEGSCPLIVFRFEPDGHSPFGIGAGIKSLPSLRVLEALTAAQQDMAEHAARPSFTYPHDGVLSFEGGIEAGKGYPALPGSGADIRELYFKGNPDAGFLTTEQLERQVRRLAYVDFPEQEGKTPPSASQWLDMMVKAQRRIGPPGQKFWREGPREVFLRYKYILEAANIVAPITAGRREGEAIALEAYNPAVKAQQLERAEQSVRFVEIARVVAPNEAELVIDGAKTIENLRTEMGEELVEMRDPKQLQQALGMLSQLAGQGGGMPPPQ